MNSIQDPVISILPFPQRLFALLENEARHGIICWANEGLCVRIVDENRFAEEVIPKYFKRKNNVNFMILTLH